MNIKELLIKIHDNPDHTPDQIQKIHPNKTLKECKKIAAEKNNALYKSGDIVCIRPQGWNWGTEELNHFLIVKMSDLTEKDSIDFTNSIETATGETDPDGNSKMQIQKRRKHKLDISRLITDIKDLATVNDMNDSFQPFLNGKLPPISKINIIDKAK